MDAAKQTTDPRTPLERAIDLTDRQLVELFQRNGLIGDADDTVYTRNALLNVARNAYWLGVSDRTHFPDRTEDLADQVRRTIEAF